MKLNYPEYPGQCIIKIVPSRIFRFFLQKRPYKHCTSESNTKCVAAVKRWRTQYQTLTICIYRFFKSVLGPQYVWVSKNTQKPNYVRVIIKWLELWVIYGIKKIIMSGSTLARKIIMSGSTLARKPYYLASRSVK
jgi:hypothetical protein